MWDEGARIYGIPGVPNNFPCGRGREDEDNDGEQRVNAVFYFSIFNKKN